MSANTTAKAPGASVPAMPSNIVISEPEAARRLGISPRTLQRWREEGGGPAFVRLGLRRVGYRPADLDAWVAARITGAAGEAAPTREARR